MKINQLLDEIDLPKRYFSEAFIIGEKFEEEASKYLTLLDNCDECDLDADKKAEFNEKLNESKRVAAEISTKIIAVFESYEESNYKVSQELFDEVMEILRPALFYKFDERENSCICWRKNNLHMYETVWKF